MPLTPEKQDSLNRWYTAIKHLEALDLKEIRGIVSTIIVPAKRERYMALNYERTVLNIELIGTLTDTRNFQAIAMLARNIFENAVELGLIGAFQDAPRRIEAFTEIEKLKYARKIVAFADKHPKSNIDTKQLKEYIANTAHRIEIEKQQLWPTATKIVHWSLMNLENRCRHLGNGFEELYQVHYSELSWYVHAGVTGVYNVPGETLSMLCAVAYTITLNSYGLILESIINEFRLHEIDDKLKKKIGVAKRIAFMTTQDQMKELMRELN